MFEDLIPDLIEVVEHTAYNTNFRSEATTKRVGELLAGIRTGLLGMLEQKKLADAAAATPVPMPGVTSAPSDSASPAGTPAAAPGTAPVAAEAPAAAGTPSETPVISQPEPTA